MFTTKPNTNHLTSRISRICVCIIVGLIVSVAAVGQTPAPTPSPAPTPITKTGSILVSNPSTVGRISKWVTSSSNGIGTIGDSVIIESSLGTIGIGTNPFSDFKLGVDGGTTAGGIFGSSINGRGVFGASNSGQAVIGTSTSGTGVTGLSTSGVGLIGQSNSSNGVQGFSVNGRGVVGSSFNNTGVHGISNFSTGVWGQANSGIGIYGSATTGYAGYFDGRVNVNGHLSAVHLSLNPGGTLKFSDGTIQTTASLVTGVTAGTGLTGGGTSGIVTVGIVNGGVNTNQIADSSVTSAKIGAGAVGGSQLADSAVNTNHLIDNSVTTAKIADNAVTDTKIGSGSIKTSHLSSDLQVSQSQVTNLTQDLAAKASDSGVVHLAGSENISGQKNFSGLQFFSGRVGIGMVQPSASELLRVEANTGAVAGSFVNNHNTNGSDALFALHTGFGNAFHALNTQIGGRAGFFETGHANNSAPALDALSPGIGPAFRARNSGTGLAAQFEGNVTVVADGGSAADARNNGILRLQPISHLKGTGISFGASLPTEVRASILSAGREVVPLDQSLLFFTGLADNPVQPYSSARMSILSNGNVGIGTTSPQTKLHVANSGGAAGQFDGNVTINGDLIVTGNSNIPVNVTHDATLSGNGSTASPLTVLSAPNGVVTTGSYANPSWLTSLDGNKVTGNINVNQVTATTITLPKGTIASDASSLTLRGLTTPQGTTGGYLSLGQGNFYYPGGAVTIGAGATSPDYDSAPGSFIRLTGNDYNSGGDILIASGHPYGATGDAGGIITLNASGAWGGHYPPPGYLSFQIGGIETLRVANNRNVGIGISAPQSKFHVSNTGGSAGQFDGNVTVNGNLTVTGTTSLASSVNHDSTLTGNGTAASPLSVVSAPNGVITTGSYANPSWITSLDGNKLTSGTVVKSVNGLTDNVTLEAGNNVTITPSGNSLTISATVPTQLNPKQLALLRWYDANTTTNSFAVGNKPIGLAFDGSSMWVANLQSDNVMKLRASDGAVLGTFTVGSNPSGVAFDGANIWVNNYGSGSVSKLQASDGSVLGTYTVGTNPFGIAFDGANIWVANSGNGVVTKLSANNGAQLGSYTVGAKPQSIAIDGTNIWVTNHSGTNVWKLRPSDGAVLGNYLVGSNPYGIAFDGSNMWVANEGSNNVMKIRASDGAILGTYGVGNVPRSVVFDGANIWVSNAFSGDVTKLRASDGAILGTYPVGAFPEHLAFDGANIWVANGGSNNVMKR